MATTLYLSGTESKRLFQPCLRAGGTAFLVSFHYMVTKRPDLLKIRKSAFPQHKFFVDSGAYTFQVQENLEEFKQRFGTWEAYLKVYTDFLKANAQYIEVAVELDVEALVGYSQVLEWQEKYFEPLEKAGMNIIYVWHPSRGMDELEAMCKRHPYVGIARDEIKQANLTFHDVEAITRKYLTKVHGFGITSWKHLKSGLFYSADSTTFLVGQQYGELCAFHGGNYIRKHWREMMCEPWFKDFVADNGFDYGLLTAEDLDAFIIRNGRQIMRWEETTAFCAKAFVDMANEYADISKGAYWDYRVPFVEVVENFQPPEVAEWAEALSLDTQTFGGPKTLELLKLIAAIQNAEWSWLDQNAKTLVDIYLKYMGSKSPSILDKDNYTKIRQMLNSKLLPMAAGSAARTRLADFEPSEELAPKPRELEEVASKSGERIGFSRSGLLPVFPRAGMRAC